MDNGRRRGDANVIGSATMPGFIRAVEACRAEVGVVEGYREWRLRWPRLDRYTAEPGRRERAEAALQTHVAVEVRLRAGGPYHPTSSPLPRYTHPDPGRMSAPGTAPLLPRTPGHTPGEDSTTRRPFALHP